MQLVILLTDALVGSRPVKHASVSLCKTSTGGSQHGTETEKSEKKHRNWWCAACRKQYLWRAANRVLIAEARPAPEHVCAELGKLKLITVVKQSSGTVALTLCDPREALESAVIEILPSFMAVDYQESWLSMRLLDPRGTRHLVTYEKVQGWLEGEWSPSRAVHLKRSGATAPTGVPADRRRLTRHCQKLCKKQSRRRIGMERPEQG